MNYETLPGIPGTVSAEAKHLRWVKKREDSFDGVLLRHYEATTSDGILKACVSRDPAGKNGALLWHISISHRDRFDQPDRVPTWDEMKHAKYQLVSVDVCMVLIFPRKTATYVNLHDTCLHLWESEDIDR
jgi:hypothetical protein